VRGREGNVQGSRTTQKGVLPLKGGGLGRKNAQGKKSYHPMANLASKKRTTKEDQMLQTEKTRCSSGREGALSRGKARGKGQGGKVEGYPPQGREGTTRTGVDRTAKEAVLKKEVGFPKKTSGSTEKDAWGFGQEQRKVKIPNPLTRGRDEYGD